MRLLSPLYGHQIAVTRTDAAGSRPRYYMGLPGCAARFDPGGYFACLRALILLFWALETDREVDVIVKCLGIHALVDNVLRKGKGSFWQRTLVLKINTTSCIYDV